VLLPVQLHEHVPKRLLQVHEQRSTPALSSVGEQNVAALDFLGRIPEGLAPVVRDGHRDGHRSRRARASVSLNGSRQRCCGSCFGQLLLLLLPLVLLLCRDDLPCLDSGLEGLYCIDL
jgi:hypothetical protein